MTDQLQRACDYLTDMLLEQHCDLNPQEKVSFRHKTKRLLCEPVSEEECTALLQNIRNSGKCSDVALDQLMRSALIFRAHADPDADQSMVIRAMQAVHSEINTVWARDLYQAGRTLTEDVPRQDLEDSSTVACMIFAAANMHRQVNSD